LREPSEVYLQAVWSNIQAVNDSFRFEDMRDSTEESRLSTSLTPILYAGLTTKQTRNRKTCGDNHFLKAGEIKLALMVSAATQFSFPSSNFLKISVAEKMQLSMMPATVNVPPTIAHTVVRKW